MKDRLYRKLNKDKPSPKVLAAAYAEMDNQNRENARSRKRAPRTVLRWAIASACSLILIVVVALAIGNPDFGIGCNSAYKDSAQSPSDNGSLSGGMTDVSDDDSDTDESGAGFVVTDEYFEEISEELGGSVAGLYSGSGDERVYVYALDAPFKIDGESAVIPSCGISVIYRAATDGYEAAFKGTDNVYYYIYSTIKDEDTFLRFVRSIEFK